MEYSSVWTSCTRRVFFFFFKGLNEATDIAMFPVFIYDFGNRIFVLSSMLSFHCCHEIDRIVAANGRYNALRRPRPLSSFLSVLRLGFEYESWVNFCSARQGAREPSPLSFPKENIPLHFQATNEQLSTITDKRPERFTHRPWIHVTSIYPLIKLLFVRSLPTSLSVKLNR